MDQPEEELEILGIRDLEFVVQAEGRKSSEGDGRTAADIERELEEEKARWDSQPQD